MAKKEPANYDVEKYAQTLEAGKREPLPLTNDVDPFKYAQNVIWCRGFNFAITWALQMLRSSASELYHTYPDFFPDHREV